jgi:hypothetical protein
VRARIRQTIGDSDAAPAAEVETAPEPEQDAESELAEESNENSDEGVLVEPPRSTPANPPPSLPSSSVDAPIPRTSPPTSNGSQGANAPARVAITAVAFEAQEDRAKIEAEARRRQLEEAERQRREQLQKKVLQAEKSSKVGFNEIIMINIVILII